MILMGDRDRDGGGSGGRRRSGGGGSGGSGGGGGKDRGRSGGGRGPREKDVPEPTRKRTIKEPEGGWSEESFQLDMTFADLGLSDDILKAMDGLGFKHPTKIQAELVPLALTEVDILGQAKTGTGKRSEERRVGKEC